MVCIDRLNTCILQHTFQEAAIALAVSLAPEAKTPRGILLEQLTDSMVARPCQGVTISILIKLACSITGSIVVNRLAKLAVLK